ncbi:MAG: 23S rRNA (pseudouridine(1915)-N(3))-methyltransferase RlmH [Pseudomonadota bacterium]|nr:23S rRNA (pseudouridine(1915)-N(3))-methyltransferase RlmH [Pseudomonadota bacterium]
MKLWVVAVGQKQPAWAQSAYAEFEKRFPPDMRLTTRAVKAETRGQKTSAQLKAAEAARLLAALPNGARRIVLDERGERVTTLQLAERMTRWRGDGRDVAFLIGGPDGLDDAIKGSADDTLRLSELTLPHAFVRVMLAEALYRAWTVMTHHPYHRE